MTTIDWLSGRDSSVAGGSISSIGNALSLWTILPYHSPHLYNIFYMNKFLIILIYTILTSLLHMSNCIRIRPRFRNHAANVERWYVPICFTHEYLFIYILVQTMRLFMSLFCLTNRVYQQCFQQKTLCDNSVVIVISLCYFLWKTYNTEIVFIY